MTQNPLHIVILAAGKGSRMQSDLPKVLHRLAGQPLLQHVLYTASQLHPQRIHVVIGHGADQVRSTFTHAEVNWVIQQQQLGTGHAVAQAVQAIPQRAQVLVLYGDTPLVSEENLRPLLNSSTESLAVLGMELDQPQGYGRLICDGEGLKAIVEEKDADDNIRAIHRVNTGIMAGPTTVFAQCSGLSRDNAQQEAYLTDLVALERSQGHTVQLVMSDNPENLLGCNSPRELERLERLVQSRQVRKLMQQGVRMADASRVDIRGTVQAGRDVELDCNVIMEGHCKLGHGVRIGAGCILSNVVLEDGVQVLPYSVLEGCKIGESSIIGPFARIRPQTSLEAQCKVGNFVEMKNAQLGSGSKVNHLSYVGDTSMGKQVNVGAGTITCNYDGAYKHKIVIGDDVFIGSNTALVAPLEIGKGATIGAGSTLSKDVDADTLAVERAPVRTVKGWKRPRKP